MEHTINFMCRVWFYIRRRHYRLIHRRIQRELRQEKIKLEADYLTRASTLDRGYLLPEQTHILQLLHLSDLAHEGIIRNYFS